MQHTTPHDELEAEQHLAPRLELRNREDELAHLVCCRADEWKVAFCGYPVEHVNLTPSQVCSMCLDVAERRHPGALAQDPAICPVDHAPCPDEHDIDRRILREITE